MTSTNGYKYIKRDISARKVPNSADLSGVSQADDRLEHDMTVNHWKCDICGAKIRSGEIQAVGMNSAYGGRVISTADVDQMFDEFDESIENHLASHGIGKTRCAEEVELRTWLGSKAANMLRLTAMMILSEENQVAKAGTVVVQIFEGDEVNILDTATGREWDIKEDQDSEYGLKLIPMTPVEGKTSFQQDVSPSVHVENEQRAKDVIAFLRRKGFNTLAYSHRGHYVYGCDSQSIPSGAEDVYARIDEPDKWPEEIKKAITFCYWSAKEGMVLPGEGKDA